MVAKGSFVEVPGGLRGTVWAKRGRVCRVRFEDTRGARMRFGFSLFGELKYPMEAAYHVSELRVV